MKSTLFRSCVILLGLALNGTSRAAEPFAITDDFLAYLKQTTNPYQFGLRPDGRFYPYSSPRGRRIGYDRVVADKAFYRSGCTQEEAEAQLRADAAKALADVAAWMNKNYAAHPFASLSRKGQEMLVDLALSETAKNIPPPFYDLVIREDWDQLFRTFVYLRWVEKGWPDTTKNKAFADRWLDPKLRLRP